MTELRPIIPSGSITGTITLPHPPVVPVVRAGDLVPATPYPQEPELITLYRFTITSEHASALGLRPGDELLIDTSTLGYWAMDDYDDEVVLVLTHYGPLICRLHRANNQTFLTTLDGHDSVLIWTPETEILGLVRQLWSWVGWDGEKGTFI